MEHEYPILEFDADRSAMIEPPGMSLATALPPHCVICFFQEVITAVCGEGRARVAGHVNSETGKHLIYDLETAWGPLAVVHPGVGAPIAAIVLEEMIAFGCDRFIACGGAGALDAEITVGHVVVPSTAVRDEGTSYHYLPPSREVAASWRGIEAITATLERHQLPYVIGKTWTTDGIFRETRRKVAQRRAEGCLTVEMEAAAFFAVAQFRGVTLAQLLYGGDDLSGEVWDHRDWIDGQASTREKLFWLAAESCLRL